MNWGMDTQWQFLQRSKGNPNEKGFNIFLNFMTLLEKIRNYIDSQPEPKRQELNDLNLLVIETLPNSKLWFFDGRWERKSYF